MLKFVYTLFLGLLIVAFVGLGIDAFYQAPVRPEYPAKLERPYLDVDEQAELSAEEKQIQNEEFEQYRQAEKEAQEKYKLYSRNVSMIALTIAILILVLSLSFASRLVIISDGAILGGVFTLIYGIIRGFNAGDSIFRFLVVTIGLVVAIILGYVKFIKPHSSSK